MLNRGEGNVGKVITCQCGKHHPATHICHADPLGQYTAPDEIKLRRVSRPDLITCDDMVEEKPKNMYLREIKPGVFVDFYDICDAFEIHDSAMAHALKKILAIGKRGHKDEAQDRKDIFDSVVRSNERFEEKQK